MHRFQTITCIGQRAVHNCGQRIGQIAVANRAPQRFGYVVWAKAGVTIITHVVRFSGPHLWRKAANIPRSFLTVTLSKADVRLLTSSLFVRGDTFMPKLITFSCFMLFWVFYEMSGGSDFTPRERVVTSQAPFAQNSRSKTSVQPSADAEFVVNAYYTPIVTSPLDTGTTEDAAPLSVATVEAPVAAISPTPPTIDLRYVAANRVNLRTGPSTTDPVIDTITRGISAEVISLNDDGWAQIRLTKSGQTGWMATRLLSEG